MKLTQQQIDDFNREGWLFLPELFSRGGGRTFSRARPSASTTPTAPRSGARRAAHRAPPLPPISTTKRSARSARTRA